MQPNENVAATEVSLDQPVTPEHQDFGQSALATPSAPADEGSEESVECPECGENAEGCECEWAFDEVLLVPGFYLVDCLGGLLYGEDGSPARCERRFEAQQLVRDSSVIEGDAFAILEVVTGEFGWCG